MKVDDMSIATPKKVTKSWKPVKKMEETILETLFNFFLGVALHNFCIFHMVYMFVPR